MSDTPKTFEIGLVMAGAVSAGAYTAGVMDFLLEALQEWQKAKEKNDAQIPQHHVRIRVMTGASAGGMTVALTAVLLNKLAKGKSSQEKSILYKAWVEEIDIEKLLLREDLKNKDQPIKSLFDSSVIEKIANELIDVKDMAKGNQWTPPPYIDKNLKLYLTLSNLRGIPYEFDVEGETGFSYGMTNHADYQYMELSEHTDKDQWTQLRNAAIATGAFPIGLASRLIERDIDYYKKRISSDGRDFTKNLKLTNTDNKAYNFVAVDGGILNNEPIELARAALNSERQNYHQMNQLSREIIDVSTGAGGKTDTKKLKEKEKQHARQTDSALIIIDPFPNVVESTNNATKSDTALSKILLPIVNALRSQSLFKPEELILSANKYIYNRFMIAPIRYQNGSRAANPIASGFLGGFGGFLSRAFREHDYQLGRRNCQQFLKKYFVIPKNEFTNNPVFEGLEFIQRFIITNDENREYYPIIPLIGDLSNEEPKKEWPNYASSEFKKLKSETYKRINALVDRLIGNLSGLLKVLRWSSLIGFIAFLFIEYQSYLICQCDLPTWIYNLETTLVQWVLMTIILMTFFTWSVIKLIKKTIHKKFISLIKELLKQYNIDIANEKKPN